MTVSGHTENSVVIAAPMDLVWDMTNDVESWPKLFSEYSAAEILATEGPTIFFRLTMHPDENGNIWSWTSKRTPDAKARTVKASRVDPGPFEYMNIFWSYREVPEGVEMRWVQDFHMKPEAPIDDDAMTRRINKNSPVQLALIKKRVEEATAGDSDGGAS